MLKIKIFNTVNKMPTFDKVRLIEFLYKHLDEYGDKREDIENAIDYALKETHSFGGFILEGFEEEKLVGAVVINRTGMKGYIPENVLVYIAVDKQYRGNGYGKSLMEKVIDLADGDIKLHVEHDNPARFLYEKLGFTNPYLEMRYKR